jgi:hypothetical protein
MHVRIMYSEIFDHEKMVFVQKPEKGSERRERGMTAHAHEDDEGRRDNRSLMYLNCT